MNALDLAVNIKLGLTDILESNALQLKSSSCSVDSHTVKQLLVSA